MNRNLKIAMLVLLLTGLVTAYFLSQQNQDVRQQASSGDANQPGLIGPPETTDLGGNPNSTPSPSPSLPPSPSSSPQNDYYISIDGDTLPNDPRINFQLLSINESLLPNQDTIFTKTVTLDDQDLTIADDYGEPGYGEFFAFYPTPGMEIEILAKELDIDRVGSYIETAFYGPDRKKIDGVGRGTRIQYVTSSREPYYLIVYTFDHKQGRAEISVTNKNRIYNKAYIKRIDQDTQPLLPGSKLGRKATDFFLQVPRIDNINHEYLTYTAQIDNELKTYVPRVKVTQTCPLTQQSKPMAVNLKRFNYTLPQDSQSSRRIKLKIYPQPTAPHLEGEPYFPPGYSYTLNLESPDSQLNWTTKFSTISQSGLKADLNDDGVVDLGDYSRLVSELMQTTANRWPRYLLSDLNCDDIVDISDYSLLINNISL